MSQIAVLSPSLSLHHTIHPNDVHHGHAQNSDIISSIIPKGLPDSESDVIGENGWTPFPSLNLPPIHSGHPDVHLRNGIMEAEAHRVLAADNSGMEEMEADWEKAFFVCDLGQVYRQHMKWKMLLPDVEPFYAVKCNPDPYVLRLLAALGTGFDCASNGEITQVTSIGGFNPSDQIIYANPCKATSHLRRASKLGVRMMTFDNIDELYKIKESHPTAQLVLRILTDDTKSLCRLSLKFGAPLETIPSLLKKAKELELDVVGISFHVGSGCYDPSVYSTAIQRSREVWDMAKNLAGFDFWLLDVGGGFEDALFEDAARNLRNALAEYFPEWERKRWVEEGRKPLRIIAEPGRFYVSVAFRLATNVIARRGGDTVMYYINDGVYGAFNCILFDHQHVHPYVLSLNGSFHVTATEPTVASSVWGPTCDSIDCVCPSTELPKSLKVGDWLGWENMGAYTVCAASQFNGFEVSRVRYTLGGLGGVGNVEVKKALARFATVVEGHSQ